MKMTQKAKSGYISTAINSNLYHDFGCCFVESGHDFHNLTGILLGKKTSLQSCGHNAHTQRFGQNQLISDSSPGISDYLVWMHHSGDGKAILWFRVIKSMATNDGHPCLSRFVTTTPQYLPQSFQGCTVGGETDYVKSAQGSASHGIDITEGIGCSNGSIVVGIIDYRRKQVNCLNQSQFFTYPIDAGIIDSAGPYQNIRIFDFG
jgi:hypothetical protein